MTRSLRIGYVLLTDAALLHVAKAQQFAAGRGLDVELVAESSWAYPRQARGWAFRRGAYAGTGRHRGVARDRTIQGPACGASGARAQR
jgi:hypothetical protein